MWLDKDGVDKVIKTTGGRTRSKISGAIRFNPIQDAISHQYNTINGDSIIDFLH